MYEFAGHKFGINCVVSHGAAAHYRHLLGSNDTRPTGQGLPPGGPAQYRGPFTKYMYSYIYTCTSYIHRKYKKPVYMRNSLFAM